MKGHELSFTFYQSVATKKEINRYEGYAKVILGSKIYQAIDLHFLHSIYMCDTKIGRVSIRYDGLDNHICIGEIDIFNPHRFKGVLLQRCLSKVKI